jgi:hypothetical protein
VQPLYGRDAVLERARRRVEQACNGHGQLLLLTGEPGIGKSRLAEQLAEEAAARGARVAYGRAWEAGGAPAYWPWIQVFRDLGLGAETLVDAAAGVMTNAEEARFVAFDRAARGLRSAAAERPLALVLDDLHAADAPSLLFLLLLVRDLARAPLLVLGTYRDAETRNAPELAALLGKIARHAEVMPLGRLSADAVAAWAHDSALGLDGARAEELYRVTEGHPLFVVEVLRLGMPRDASGAWPTGPGVLDERLGAISHETRAMLDVAAVLGRDFSRRDLSATSGASPDRVFAALREALAASIVVAGQAPDDYRFSHVLLRDRLYADLLPSARERLHQRAAQARLQRGASPESVVHDLFEAGGAAAAQTVAEVARDAAQAELSRLAFEDAARIGRRALGLEPAGLPDRLLAELRLIVAEASIRLGDSAAGKALCVEAAARAERAGEGELVARAGLVYGTELASGTIDPQMIALLRNGLARLGSERTPLRARVMARLAAALTPPMDRTLGPEIIGLMRGALGLARELGDRHALLYVLQFGATVALLVPEQERFAIMAETMDLARELQQPLTLLTSLPAFITALLARGDRARAEAELPAYDALLAEFPQPLHRLRRLLVESLLATLAGEHAAAERAQGEALLCARHSPSGPGRLLWLTHRLAIAQLLARPDELGEHAATLLAVFEQVPSAIPYTAWLLIVDGRPEECRERLRQSNLEPLDIPSANLMDLMGAAEAAVLLDDRELGQRLYPVLTRAADRMLWNLAPGALLGPTARVLGDLAVCIGRDAEAAQHYADALAFAEKLRSPPLIELCRSRAASLAGRTTQPDAAVAPTTPPGSAAPSAADATAPALTAGPLPQPAALPSGIAPPLLRREAELWVLEGPGDTVLRLRPSKGLDYLERLLASPGRSMHVLELAGIEHFTGDAGAVLDPRAKLEYRRRLDDLGEALAEAERFGDVERSRSAQQEIDALAEQLAQAVGLGGRDRRAASDVERARVNVQRRLKDAIARIAAADPALGRYLAASVQTGTYCVFRPL